MPGTPSKVDKNDWNCSGSGRDWHGNYVEEEARSVMSNDCTQGKIQCTSNWGYPILYDDFHLMEGFHMRTCWKRSPKCVLAEGNQGMTR